MASILKVAEIVKTIQESLDAERYVDPNQDKDKSFLFEFNTLKKDLKRHLQKLLTVQNKTFKVQDLQNKKLSSIVDGLELIRYELFIKKSVDKEPKRKSPGEIAYWER